MQSTIFILIGLVAGLVIAVLVVMLMRARAISSARNRFGREYHRTVKEAGGRHKAATLLHQREKRVEKIKLHQISGDVREAFDARWAQAQAGFIDSPLGAVNTADALLEDVLTARGYPEAKFEQRAADLSVHHADIVDRYRDAHELALHDGEEDANTEDLRQAMLSLKALYEAVVGPMPAMIEAQPTEEIKGPTAENIEPETVVVEKVEEVKS